MQINKISNYNNIINIRDNIKKENIKKILII